MTAAATVTNCVISNGRVNFHPGAGGNIYMTAGLIVDSRISGGNGNVNYNSCPGYSIYASAGRLMRCAVVNGAHTAAGDTSLIRLAGAVTLENCLIAGNEGRGSNNGLVHVSHADARVVNCTIAGNNTVKGGIYLQAGQVYNTVMYNNGGTAEKEWGGLNGASFFNCATMEGITITGGTACQTLDSIAINVFEDTTDWVPLAATPLMDNGSGTYYTDNAISETDLIGAARTSGTQIDIGCYEHDQSSLSASGKANAYAVLEGADVVFTGYAAGGVGDITYDWDFGNGVSVSGLTTNTYTYQYPTAGLFTAEVTAHRGTTNATATLVPIRVGPPTMFVKSGNGAAQFPYTNATIAAATLADALNALTNTLSSGVTAVNGVTVRLADGTYTEHGFLIGSGVKIVGNSGNRDAVIVDANSAGRAFTLSDDGAMLANLTVTGGYLTDGAGANIYMTAAATVTNCVISDGTVAVHYGYGGNIYMTGAGLIVDSRVSGGSGGTFSSTAYSIYASAGRLMRCAVVNGTYGTGNSSAIYLAGAVTLENCLIAGNRCSGDTRGAIVYVNNTSAKVVNCTIAGNNTVTRGGIYLAAAGQVYNTVIYNNGGTAEKEWGNANGGSFYNCATEDGITITSGNNCVTLDSTALNVFENTTDWVPLAATPLIDNGSDSYYEENAISGTDLIGAARTSGAQIDIGCYERQPPAGTMILLR